MSKKSFKPQAGFPESTNRIQTNNIEQLCCQWAEQIGATPISLPMVEKRDLFERGVGKGTDVVDKEMIIVKSDKEDLVLRPEGTSGAIRLWNNQGGRNIGPQKWYYNDFMFRNERQQAGRYKQFKQFGLEIIGQKEGFSDIEMLVDIYRLFKMLRIDERVSLKLNNIGSVEERELYKKEFIQWIEPLKDKLDSKSLEKLTKNPLRILDSKDENTQCLLKGSPKIKDFIDKEKYKTWKENLKVLNDLNIPYEIDDNLLRGLDYYNGMVFEWVSNDTDSAQNAVAAGGRYDNLSVMLGGENTSALGFAIGIERVLLITPNISNTDRNGIYICWMGDVLSFALQVKNQLIISGKNNIIIDDGSKNLSKQIKRADEKMFKYLVVIGENEKTSGEVFIKDLETGFVEKI